MGSHVSDEYYKTKIKIPTFPLFLVQANTDDHPMVTNSTSDQIKRFTERATCLFRSFLVLEQTGKEPTTSNTDVACCGMRAFIPVHDACLAIQTTTVPANDSTTEAPPQVLPDRRGGETRRIFQGCRIIEGNRTSIGVPYWRPRAHIKLTEGTSTELDFYHTSMN